ncbi:hypothetical protein M413DRAFT_32647 [Hebeloma cylindrosporum]|uniref:Protein kinase domain-containing protein n=1 Tax=Hebeloma cylindrosporum TaxID=76867 RepID=A0A0C2XBA5_HEBCY|nr:hypothetical protein M413DRAFT_32647 [Hebeloma cylindrosporum h7]
MNSSLEKLSPRNLGSTAPSGSSTHHDDHPLVSTPPNLASNAPNNIDSVQLPPTETTPPASHNSGNVLDITTDLRPVTIRRSREPVTGRSVISFGFHAEDLVDVPLRFGEVVDEDTTSHARRPSPSDEEKPESPLDPEKWKPALWTWAIPSLDQVEQYDAFRTTHAETGSNQAYKNFSPLLVSEHESDSGALGSVHCPPCPPQVQVAPSTRSETQVSSPTSLELCGPLPGFGRPVTVTSSAVNNPPHIEIRRCEPSSETAVHRSDFGGEFPAAMSVPSTGKGGDTATLPLSPEPTSVSKSGSFEMSTEMISPVSSNFSHAIRSDTSVSTEGDDDSISSGETTNDEDLATITGGDYKIIAYGSTAVVLRVPSSTTKGSFRAKKVIALTRADSSDFLKSHGSESFYTSTLAASVYLNGIIAQDEEALLTVMAEIAQGLSYLHSLDIVHLDIKPFNVFLTHTRHCVIGDFGSSRHDSGHIQVEEPGLNSLTITHGVTVGFVAPEVATRAEPGGVFNCKADIWSLGVSIFTLIDPSGIEVPDDYDSNACSNLEFVHYKEMGLLKFDMRRTLLEANAPDSVMRLVLEMCEIDDRERPTARELLAKMKPPHPLDSAKPSPLFSYEPAVRDPGSPPPRGRDKFTVDEAVGIFQEFLQSKDVSGLPVLPVPTATEQRIEGGTTRG